MKEDTDRPERQGEGMTAQDVKDWRVLCTDMYVMLERGELEPHLAEEWRRRWRALAEQSFTHQELFQAGLAPVTLGIGDHLLFSLEFAEYVIARKANKRDILLLVDSITESVLPDGRRFKQVMVRRQTAGADTWDQRHA